MSDFKDHFSHASGAYRTYRPSYPAALFSWLGEQCSRHQVAWDCGCGTGQAALMLRPHFERIIATDPSAEQIRNAVADPQIEYRVAPAEQSGLPESSIDLLVVAQALHWFDFERFYQEARRVCRPNALLAAITYDLQRSDDPAIDRIIDRFYYQTIGRYWPPERRHVDARYQSIPFPFTKLPSPDFTSMEHWDLPHLLGYLGTWSAVKEYTAAHRSSPLDQLQAELAAAWGSPERPRAIRWPITLLVGRVTT